MKSFVLALSFLTVLPLGGGREEVTEGELVASTFFYPLVGVLLGLLLAGVSLGAGLLWPGLVAPALTVAAWALLTAGLHLDGLMDTFDGLGVRGDRERRLAVMRDSRVGAFGVQAAVLFLLLKVAAVSALAAGPWLWQGLVLAAVAGRSAMVALMAAGRYARPGEGLGRAFVAGTGLRQALPAAVFFTVSATLLPGKVFAGVILAQAALLLVLHRFFAAAFGGLTGDLLGAACELHELAALLAVAAFTP